MRDRFDDASYVPDKAALDAITETLASALVDAINAPCDGPDFFSEADNQALKLRAIDTVRCLRAAAETLYRISGHYSNAGHP